MDTSSLMETYMDRDQLHRELLEDQRRWEEYKTNVLSNDLGFDEDGYPTEVALEAIEKWHWSDARDMFNYIRTLWAYGHSGYWKEEMVTRDDVRNLEYKEPRQRYYLSTAGWSGNEAIIRAMERNEMMWNFNWVQSRRGGHYIFELKEFDE